uniref:PDZ domain-containing protein n=1 Tax=Caenorhabditis tropicalis TaxID=1561998 RepID=A0A1I7V449_9PELO
MAREKKRAFRAGKFPEDIITKDMIREMTCTIDCAPGTPDYKEFKVTEGMLFTKVPKSMSPPIEYCDHLLKINGISITSRKQMLDVIYKVASTNKSHYMVFTVRRVIYVEKIDNRSVPSNASIRKPDTKNKTVKPNFGYAYYKVVLIYFPRSKLGINVKSYADVVYVESTDNSWGSTTRRFLFLGDAILKVDDTEIQDVQTAQAAIRNGFQKNGIITLIIERAIDQASNCFVRNVLSWSKVIDPHIPADVRQICAERLALYEKDGFAEPVPIFKGYTKDYSKSGRVSVTSLIEVKTIGSEQFNPISLLKVPDFSNPDYKNK